MFLVLRILFGRYVESSISEDEQSTWRRSSTSLLKSLETIPRFNYNNVEILMLHDKYFSPQETLSTSSSYSQSNRSRLDAACNKNEAHANQSSAHYFGWDKGIVKLRKTLNINTNVKSNQDELHRESSDIGIRGSVRDSGETIIEDL